MLLCAERRQRTLHAACGRVADRQWQLHHRPGNRRVWLVAGLGAVLYAGAQSGIERDGRVLREDLQAGLRVCAGPSGRSDCPGEAGSLIRRLQRLTPAQGPENEILSGDYPHRISNTVSDLIGATPAQDVQRREDRCSPNTLTGNWADQFGRLESKRTCAKLGYKNIDDL